MKTLKQTLVVAAAYLSLFLCSGGAWAAQYTQHSDYLPGILAECSQNDPDFGDPMSAEEFGHVLYSCTQWNIPPTYQELAVELEACLAEDPEGPPPGEATRFLEFCFATGAEEPVSEEPVAQPAEEPAQSEPDATADGGTDGQDPAGLEPWLDLVGACVEAQIAAAENLTPQLVAEQFLPACVEQYYDLVPPGNMPPLAEVNAFLGSCLLNAAESIPLPVPEGAVGDALLACVLSGDDGAVAAQDLPACPAGPLFTHAPVAAEDIGGIVPLGSFHPQAAHVFPTHHMYAYGKLSDPDNDPGQPRAVNAPGDLKLTRVVMKEYLNEDGSIAMTDFSLYMRPCAEVKLYYHHVQTLTQSLLDQVGAFDQEACTQQQIGIFNMRSCVKNVDINLTAGSQIGTIGVKTPYGPSALDIGLYDTRVATPVQANPSRWTGDDLNLVCALDYVDDIDGLQSQLKAKLGSYDGSQLRTAAPVCGEVYQDIPGTAQGAWFNDAEPRHNERAHLNLAHDNIDPKIGVISMGESVPGLAVAAYRYQPQSSGHVNRDVRDIYPDGTVYCFEQLELNYGPQQNLAGVILLELLDTETLQVEYQASGTCAEPVFTQNAVQFKR